MTAPVYLDYHQKATFLLCHQRVARARWRIPGEDETGMWRGVWGDGEKENACPNFFGRRASVSGKQVRKNGTEWKVGTLGKDEKEKGAAAR